MSKKEKSDVKSASSSSAINTFLDESNVPQTCYAKQTVNSKHFPDLKFKREYRTANNRRYVEILLPGRKPKQKVLVVYSFDVEGQERKRAAIPRAYAEKHRGTEGRGRSPS